jgi:DNA-binding CsgD family transcriptional regulator
LFKKVVIYLLLFNSFIGLFQGISQIKDVGLPFINNYSREDYDAGTQNWSITQDDQGIMYFANNKGILSYNGSKWDIFPLRNNSIVRTVFSDNNKIYAGGNNEFGYFEKDEKGNFVYFSLSSELDSNYKNIDEIWRIFAIDDKIVFQSYFYIFIYSKSGLDIIEPKSKFGFSYKVGEDFFIVDKKTGLYKLQGDKLEVLIEDEHFFIENELTFLIPHKYNNFLIGTTNAGIFISNKKELLPWNTEINEVLIKDQVYTGIVLKEEVFALGTIQNGVFILRNDGEVIQHLNRTKGLQNNTVLSLFYDHDKNLWLGLDNGIDMLELNSPFTLLNYCSNIETAYVSIVFGNKLYIGTNQGLFVQKLDEIQNRNYLDNKFEIVKGTRGQVWKLEIIDDKLICGHNFGSFIINDKVATLVSDIPGAWDFEIVPWNTNYVIGGTYTGLVLYKRNNNLQHGWESLGRVEGFNESSKELMFDENKNLWITHGLKGVFKLTLTDDFSKVKHIDHFKSDEGLITSPHTLTKIQNKMYILSNDSLLFFNYSNKKFSIDKKLVLLFNGITNMNKIIEDSNGDIWYFTDVSLGVFRLLEDGTYTKITSPFNRIQKNFVSTPFENVYSIDKSNCFIGSQDGVLHYSSSTTKDYEIHYHTYINVIKARSRNIDTINIQNSLSENIIQIALKDSNTIIPYKYNSISFEFFTSYYEAPKFIDHSYRLLGYDEQWSAWNNLTYKEYTNLREGDYVFEVKARNIYGQESEMARYKFEVTPPIYRSLFAYVFYALTLLVVLIVNIVFFKLRIDKARTIEKQKLISKEKEFKKEVQLSEAKIEELQQEKLRNEMRHKNMELANSTMNLIHKNKLLNKLKQQLADVNEKARSNVVKVDIKQIIARIDRDLTNEKNLVVFDKYFDQVHQDFINRMKNKHPNLTPKDLRLCAYLRMNLSTKEIAPLMNVSVRGLEISRYRLRKKLEIEHEINLVDYIMEI